MVGLEYGNYGRGYYVDRQASSLPENVAAARLGKLTASRFSDVVAKPKDKSAKESLSRIKYRAELVSERLSGTAFPSYQSPAMKRGIETEAQSKAAYSFITGQSLVVPGFVPHPEIEMAGATPDALVGDDGLAEFKCPDIHTHVSFLLDVVDIVGQPFGAPAYEALIPNDYRLQMLWQLACSKRTWCDYVSFCQQLPMKIGLVIVRYTPTTKALLEAELAAQVFLREVDDVEQKLRGML
jgi:hypothetical protein